jgi:hypothetical protein
MMTNTMPHLEKTQEKFDLCKNHLFILNKRRGKKVERGSQKLPKTTPL